MIPFDTSIFKTSRHIRNCFFISFPIAFLKFPPIHNAASPSSNTLPQERAKSRSREFAEKTPKPHRQSLRAQDTALPENFSCNKMGSIATKIQYCRKKKTMESRRRKERRPNPAPPREVLRTESSRN